VKIHVHGNAEEYDQAARVLTRSFTWYRPAIRTPITGGAMRSASTSRSAPTPDRVAAASAAGEQAPPRQSTLHRTD
jgi:hypothetical protein